MDFRHHIRPTRSMLSGYYISILFATLVFRLQPINKFILSMQDFVQASMERMFNVASTNSSAIFWFSLVLVCFFVVFLIKVIIVDPIHLSIEDESGVNAWEKVFFFFMTLGAFLYYVNDYFGIAMPPGFSPIVRQILGDKVISGADALRLSAILWNLGPLLTIFFIVRTKGKSEGGEGH